MLLAEPSSNTPQQRELTRVPSLVDTCPPPWLTYPQPDSLLLAHLAPTLHRHWPDCGATSHERRDLLSLRSAGATHLASTPLDVLKVHMHLHSPRRLEGPHAVWDTNWQLMCLMDCRNYRLSGFNALLGEDGRVNLVTVGNGKLERARVHDSRGLVSYTVVRRGSPMEFATGGLGFGLQWWDLQKPGGWWLNSRAIGLGDV